MKSDTEVTFVTTIEAGMQEKMLPDEIQQNQTTNIKNALAKWRLMA